MDSSTLKKACSYCIYQERTQSEVREKLKSWSVYGDSAEEIIVWLISENFINEGRYARQFAGGKFRVKKWGKKKIVYELKAKGLSQHCIQEAISEINDEDYQETLRSLVEQKRASLSDDDHILVNNRKIINYLLNKGFEMEEILPLVKGH